MFDFERLSTFSLNLATTWQMVVKRTIAHWRIMSSVLIGVVLASAIMSGTVIYYDALREVALSSTLAQKTVTERDILLEAQWGPTTAEQYATLSAITEGEVFARAAWMLRDQVRSGKTPTLFLTEPGSEEQAGDDDARTFFAFLPSLAQHVSLLEGGRLPGDGRVNAPEGPPELEAMVPLEAARLFGAEVGQRFVAVPPFSDVQPYITVVISGIFQKTEPADEEFWYLDQRALLSATAGFRTLPFYISERAFMDVVGSAFRKMDGRYSWLLETDVSRIDATNAEATLANLETMSRTLASALPNFSQTTLLDIALSEYDRKIFFSKLPMFVVLVLIAIVVLYYITTLSSLVVENRRGEVALMRSRGANAPQILAVFVIEGANIAVLATIVGPIVAAVAIGALGLTPAFSDLTGSQTLSVSISRGAYLMSALGGLLSFVALIVPSIQASRIGVVQERAQSARPATLPAFQRYYLDVLLLLVSIFLFLRLTEQGSVVATNLLGEASVNQMLLALPGLVLVTAAMILLRLFPLGIGAATRALSPWLPAGLIMGAWQMSRNPTHYARLSLLLILTAGLGIFASSFGATLQRSFEERVLYATGSDFRIDSVSAKTGANAPSATPGDSRVAFASVYEQVPGVGRASPVLRSPGRDLSQAAGGGFQMLAIDGESFAEVAWFRRDFSDKPMADLLETLTVENPPQGLALAGDSTSIGVRVRPDRALPTVKVTARVRNARNDHHNYALGTLDINEWLDLETPLDSGPLGFAAARPLTLVSLRVEETGLNRRLGAGSIAIDEIWVGNGTGGTATIEPFDSAAGWNVLISTESAIADKLLPFESASDSERSLVLFQWSSGPPLTVRGIFYGAKPAPLPVLASETFIDETRHSIGDEFEVSVGESRVPAVLTGIVNLFPTMTRKGIKYLVSDVTALDRYANLGGATAGVSTEVWVSSAGDGSAGEDVVAGLEGVPGYTVSSIQDRARRLEAFTVDPLVEAGWRALLFLAFAAVLILSCLGFLVHAYVSFRNRQVQFALLRTVGFSMRQLTTTVWLEQALVIALGLALGTWMGGRLGSTIMPFLGHDDFGKEVVPPFAIEVNWGALLLTYAAMVVVFVFISFGLIWFIRRLSLQRILRLGEM